jgi:hypothetical protein
MYAEFGYTVGYQFVSNLLNYYRYVGTVLSF